MSRPADLGEVRTIYSLLRAFTRPWHFAGGWALDLYLGKETRPHEDVEIAVFRRDQFALREYLVGWSFQKAIPGEKRLEPWSEGELLGPPIHEVHCIDGEHELEILFEEADLASPSSTAARHTEGVFGIGDLGFMRVCGFGGGQNRKSQ